MPEAVTKRVARASAARPSMMGARHAVAAGHYLATQAAFAVLEAGGNAIDAGVAGGLALNVVESQMCGLAGVAPIMIRLASGETVTIDGLGTWPRRASCQYFIERGMDVVPRGILQTVVPAAAAAWLTALERWGTMRFADVAGAALRFARDGFPMHPQMSVTLDRLAVDYPPGSEAARIFMPSGKAPLPGEIFVQSDLADTIETMIAAEKATVGSREAGIAGARQFFYRGDIARRIADFHRANGGLLDGEDMANYRVTISSPERISFRGIDVYGCGPWCQGPLLLQALKVLEQTDLTALGWNSAAYLHWLVEAVKLGAADREAFYGDPNFVDVPIATLLSDEYARERARLIDPAKAWPGMPPAGLLAQPALPAAGTVANDHLDTSYVCVVDAAGNAFSATPSDAVMRGAPVVPGTGLIPSPRGIQSRIDPTHPSSIAPGKRPRLTPSPAIAVKNGAFVMPFGTPGGDLQTQAMAQVFLNIVLFGMEPQQAVDAPRVYSYSFPDSFAPHTYLPGRLRYEEEIAPETVAALAELGHEMEKWPGDEWPRSGVCAVLHDLQRDIRIGAADRRRTGTALAA